MFAISVPVKSHVGYLAEALASLRAQAAPCSVALLDASGDPAIPVIADASGLAFALRRHAPDAGQAAAIAEGWQKTSDEILGWLNDDDRLLPGALAAVAEIFAAEPDTDVVYGHGVMRDETGAFTGYFPSISEDSAELRFSNIICQPAAFVRRTAVERVGGLDTALHYTMDWDLWLRLYDAGARFRFVDRPLAAVRSHAATKTRSGGGVRWRETRRLMQSRMSRRALRRLRLGMALSEARDNRASLRARVLELGFSVARRGRPAHGSAAPIYGLDRIDNRVDDVCTLVMPVDGDVDTVDLRVTTDRDQTLTASTARGDVSAVRLMSDQPGKYFDYRLQGIPVAGGLVRCQLKSPASVWRLYRVVAE